MSARVQEEQTAGPAGPVGDGGDVVTRLLCSAAYLNEDVARTVNQEIIKQPFRAVSPCWGADVRAITRHAVRAMVAAKQRDDQLATMVLATAAALVVLGMLDWLWPTVPLAACAGVLLSLLLAVGGCQVYAFHRRMRDRAREVMFDAAGAEELLRLAPPLDAFLETTLGELTDANVVAFRHGYPFIGSGRRVAGWTLVVDVGRAATRPGGAPRAVEAFDVATLHAALEAAAGPLGRRDMRAQQRLYVHGASVPEVPGLLTEGPGVPQRPRARVDEGTLRQVALDPSAGRRVYVCFERSGWGEHLVVSLFVRCSRRGSTLVVEGEVCALLPLAEEVVGARELPRSLTRERFQVAGITLRRAVPLVLGSPTRVLARFRAGHAFRRRITRQIRQIERQDVPFNFGADTSVREMTAEPEDYWHFATMDEQADARLLQHRVFDRLVHFLSERGVDTADLVDDQIRPIIWGWVNAPEAVDA